MQCIVREGEDYVWATHDDWQDVADRYPAQTLQTDAGTVTIPRGVVIKVPDNFAFAVDVIELAPATDLGPALTITRLKDPRRFAGEGSTPLGETIDRAGGGTVPPP
jgi:hypothetical protein